MSRRKQMIVIVGAIALCAFGLFGSLYPRHSTADSDLVQFGMTFDEVTAILGKPSMQREHNGKLDTNWYVWNVSDGVINLMFDKTTDPRVRMKNVERSR